MVFKIAKFMDEGTRNPVVARLSVGISEILPFTTLTKAQSDEVFATAMEVMQIVVQAQKTAAQTQGRSPQGIDIYLIECSAG